MPTAVVGEELIHVQMVADRDRLPAGGEVEVEAAVVVLTRPMGRLCQPQETPWLAGVMFVVILLIMQMHAQPDLRTI